MNMWNKRRRVRINSIIACVIITAMTLCMLPVNVVNAEKYQVNITPSGIYAEDIEEIVDSYMNEYIGKTIPGAAVVIVKDGNILLSKGYGFSNVEKKTKTSPSSTMFEYSNLTRAYTNVAIMQLVEQGKLELDADIFSYLPDDVTEKLRKHLISETPITLTHLINNTAGFEEKEFDGVYYTASRVEDSLKEAVMTAMPYQVYAPGEVMTSSQYSAALAGYIVECVSGQTFTDYITKNILEAMQAENTSCVGNYSINAKIINGKATPYQMLSEKEFKETYQTYSNLVPSNGMVGTVEDLGKFMLTFLPEEGEDGSLLSKESLQQMFTSTYAVNEYAKGQTLGLFEYPANVNAYYYDGGNVGYSSMMTIVPESRFGVAILTNGGSSTEFLYGLTNKLILNEDNKETYQETTLPSVDEVVKNDYIGAKRAQSNMLEMFGYFGNCVRFEKVDETTISLGGVNYKQVAPYVYEYAGDQTSALLDSVVKYIYFGHTEEGKVTKWSYAGSGIVEYVSMDGAKSQDLLGVTFLALIFIGLIAAILFTVNVVRFVLDVMHRRVKWRDLRAAFRIFSLLFVGLVLNVISTVMRLLSLTDLVAADFRINIYINYCLAVLGVLSMVNVLRKAKIKELTPAQIMLSALAMIAFVGFVILLYIWNFFALM